MDNRWLDRCREQAIFVLPEETRRAFLSEYGILVARCGAGVYPLGSFELCGEGLAAYPAQTLNALEEQGILAVSTCLALVWDQTGFLTLRYVKQRDGSDFALTDIVEEIVPEAKFLLELRGLTEWADSFATENSGAPVLEGLTSAAVSFNGKLYKDTTLRGALKALPKESSPSGWFADLLNKP